MKIWTYLEARTKLLTDLDLLDETFITPGELIGYFNEGIEEAEGEILKLDEDYLLSSYPLPVVAGQGAYPYPPDIYGFKIRGIVYTNGSTIYGLRRFARRNKFECMAYASQFAASDDYQWFHTNAASGQAAINILPPSRETAVVPPNANPFTPLIAWYIRHANRIPLLGEYLPLYDQIVQATAVSTVAETLTVNQTYVTGDQVKLASTSSMPGGLAAGTVYYVILVSPGLIKLATTLQNALLGTAINLTSTGAGVLTISIAANQTIIDNTPIDIPEFTKFVIQWAKCQCLDKDSDPRLEAQGKLLEQQREQMVSTLSVAQQDDQNEITPDLSAYTEMS